MTELQRLRDELIEVLKLKQEAVKSGWKYEEAAQYRERQKKLEAEIARLSKCADLKPIPKRNYYFDEVEKQLNPKTLVYDKGYDHNLQMIYERFFKHNDCRLFYQLSNFHSEFDALLTSGYTTGDNEGESISIPIEYKKRTMSVVQFDSVMLERPKYDSLLNAKKLMSCPAAFYIMEFTEVILVFDVERNPDLVWKSEVHLKDNSEIKEYKIKEVTYLPYSSACIVISKKDWQRKSIEDLNHYIKEVIRRNAE